MLGFLGTASYAGSFGGRGWLPSPWDEALVAAGAIGFYIWAQASGFKTPDLEASAASPRPRHESSVDTNHAFTTNTGLWARCTTRSLTLPMSSVTSGLWPRRPSTIRS